MKKILPLILSLSILLLLFNSCSPEVEDPESKDFDMFAEYEVVGGFYPEHTAIPGSMVHLQKARGIKESTGFLVKVRAGDENSIVTVPRGIDMILQNTNTPNRTKLIKLKILDIYVIGERYYYPLGLNEEVWFDMRCDVDEEAKTMRNDMDVFIVPGEEFLMYITTSNLTDSTGGLLTYSGNVVMRTYHGGIIPLSMSEDEYIRLLMLNNFDAKHSNGTKYDFEAYKQRYYSKWGEVQDYMKELMEEHNKVWHTNGQTSCGEMN